MALASRRKRPGGSGFCAISAGNTLSATPPPSFVSAARYTSPLPPAPREDWISVVAESVNRLRLGTENLPWDWPIGRGHFSGTSWPVRLGKRNADAYSGPAVRRIEEFHTLFLTVESLKPLARDLQTETGSL